MQIIKIKKYKSKFGLFLYIFMSFIDQASGYTCSLVIPKINFNNFIPITNSNTIISSTISVTCIQTTEQTLVNYTLTFNTGSSNSYSARTMKGGSHNLDYQIYDSGKNILGGGNSAGTVTITDSYNLLSGSTTKYYTIYAVIFAQPFAIPSTYTDTITVTLDY